MSKLKTLFVGLILLSFLLSGCKEQKEQGYYVTYSIESEKDFIIYDVYSGEVCTYKSGEDGVARVDAEHLVGCSEVINQTSIRYESKTPYYEERSTTLSFVNGKIFRVYCYNNHKSEIMNFETDGQPLPNATYEEYEAEAKGRETVGCYEDMCLSQNINSIKVCQNQR